MSVLRILIALGAIGAVVSGVQAEDCPSLDPQAPRTLILALDGVPYESVLAAQEMGAFKGWAKPRPMVSPFPSMTNVGFAAILHPRRVIERAAYGSDQFVGRSRHAHGVFPH